MALSRRPTASRGKTLGAQRATVSSQYLEDNYRKVAKIKVYDKQTAAWLDLKAGRVDAILSDLLPSYDWVKKNKGFEMAGGQISNEDKIGIAARKEDTALLEKVNAAILALRKNGTYAKINAKYFPFDIY